MDKGVLARIGFYFISSRLIFLEFAVLASYFIPLRQGYTGNQFDPHAPYLTWIWANFDGRHFLSIATQGYQRTNFAYFPLYPALISLIGSIVPLSHLVLGVLISLLFCFLAFVMLYKIFRLDYKPDIAFLTLSLLSIFSLSFFYHAVYADSLFLFLTVASFYFARKNKWGLSGILCAFATATRLSGVALLPALLVEWYLQDKRFKKSLKLALFKTGLPILILGSLGIVLYIAYLQIYFGDPLLFQKSFSAWNQAGIVFPPQVIYRYLKIFLSVNPQTLVFWIAVLEFVSLFGYLALSLYVLKRVRISYGVFMVMLLLLVTFTGTFAGTPRYGLHLFPLFLGLAILLSKRPILKFFVYLLFLILGLALTALFTRGYFVA